MFRVSSSVGIDVSIRFIGGRLWDAHIVCIRAESRNRCIGQVGIDGWAPVVEAVMFGVTEESKYPFYSHVMYSYRFSVVL